MERRFTRRLLFAALLVILSAVSCRQGPRVIPKARLAQIYADMFVADQWIATNSLSRTADTSAVYEPILNRYGYTSADFRRSLDHYLDDPEEMVKILKASQSILQKNIAALSRQEKADHQRDSLRREHERERERIRQSRRTDFVPYWVPPEEETAGTIQRVEIDKNGVWRLVFRERDTLYAGPVVRIREAMDSLKTPEETPDTPHLLESGIRSVEPLVEKSRRRRNDKVISTLPLQP